MGSILNSEWSAKVASVLEHRDKTIAQVVPDISKLSGKLGNNVIDVPRQYLSAEAIEITESSTEDLIASLASGKLSAVTAVQAFLRRAAIAQKLVNCVYELLPERAITRAKELDEIFTKSGPVGPLHGLPISVKAHVGLKGLPNSGGFVGWVEQNSPEDAVLVQILLAAGAVLYVRTTEPQGLMALETRSNITGVTTNPYNVTLTPGGSSGGESALQALSGSVLGIGSDIGGSIRSPAACSGIYGLKPTTFRLPIIGASSYLIGCETVWGTLGPLSTSLEGLDIFMKTVLNSKPWRSDLSLHQVPWRTPELPKKLTIGVMWDDGVVKPSPPVTRAMKEMVEKLKGLPDFEVIENVDWTPFKVPEAIELLKKLYAPDGGEAFSNALKNSGEPWEPLCAWVLKDQAGIQAGTQHDVWRWTLEREMYRWSFLQEWNKVAPEMDVILCPPGPIPAPKHGTSRYWGYTSLWNLLDYPGIVFPVTKVSEADAKDASYKPRNEMDQWCYDNYEAEEQKDAPVGLQLIAKRMHDENVVEALRRVKSAIGLPFAE